MRNKVSLTVRDGDYAVTLTVWQKDVVRGSLAVLTELSMSPERMIVQFGFEKAELEEMVGRLDATGMGGAELVLTGRDLRMVYLALWQVPEMFGSEEAFHTRVGFFTEQPRGLARELLAAVDRATQ